ncbi:uncharacterized protein LOC6638090 [Drosophila willistoni]|uniref:uncharacterized protein LOC6638090 n=1 Tax=Drosophila willistoni TaxID=7260 RepID=UPI001F079E55|nr:uncharacterized protein LOC6638090 [Drosophila willistoni]
MDTKLEARGQFPATFPETFKNFFEMMNEDEDHVEIFANLLEDKVIPRQNKSMYSQRQRCGGSLRSHSSGERNSERERNRDRDKGRSNLQQQQQYPNPLQQQMSHKPRSRSGSISDMSQGDGLPASVGYGNRFSGSGVVVVGRSDSFRMNRQPRQSLSVSSSGIDHIGYGDSCPDGGGSLIDVAGRGEQPMHAERDCGASLGKSGNLLCKHIKYCCLHQPTQQSPAVDGQQQSLPCDAVASCSGNKLQRLGPDGEDNSTSLRIGAPPIPPHALTPRHTSATLDSALDFPADCLEAEPAWVKRSVVTDDALFRSVQWSNALYNHHPSISSNVDPEPHSVCRSRLRFWHKMLGYFVQCRRGMRLFNSLK